jgi:NhaP-type Na+/H+ or K+/H+ antiporter
MRGRLLIAWFGPRGLSSLLLILLPVFAGFPGSGYLFAVCSLVVLVSVVLHGGSPMLLTRVARMRASEHTAAASEDTARPDESSIKDRVTSSAASERRGVGEELPKVGSQRITIDELERLRQLNEPVTILDVRTERSLEGSDLQAKGAIRMPPDNVIERARELGLNKDAWLIAYCT